MNVYRTRYTRVNTSANSFNMMEEKGQAWKGRLDRQDNQRW